MKIDCDWNGKQNFVAHINGFKVLMDAELPFGDGLGPNPNELVLAALCGSTGMNVVGVLKKNNQSLEKLSIEADADIAPTDPHELKDVKLSYLIGGSCDPIKVAEAVRSSHRKYCAVSSMISRGTSVAFKVSLNGKKIDEGWSSFYDRDSYTYSDLEAPV